MTKPQDGFSLSKKQQQKIKTKNLKNIINVRLFLYILN